MYAFVKRAGDLFVALVVLVIISLPLLLVILALRFTAEGKVFYTQTRIGRNGVKFGMVKFATMLQDSPNMALGHITVRDDPRVTPVGKYLRSSKVNELPQLFNVIGGTMSWVGPRPLVQRALDAYTEVGRAMILRVKPGITGIGSLYFRDEEGLIAQLGDDVRVVYDEVIAPYKEDLERWYTQHASVWVDFKIILLTALAVVSPQAISLDAWFSALPAEPTRLRMARETLATS